MGKAPKTWYQLELKYCRFCRVVLEDHQYHPENRIKIHYNIIKTQLYIGIKKIFFKRHFKMFNIRDTYSAGSNGLIKGTSAELDVSQSLGRGNTSEGIETVFLGDDGYLSHLQHLGQLRDDVLGNRTPAGNCCFALGQHKLLGQLYRLHAFVKV